MSKKTQTIGDLTVSRGPSQMKLEIVDVADQVCDAQGQFKRIGCVSVFITRPRFSVILVDQFPTLSQICTVGDR